MSDSDSCMNTFTLVPQSIFNFLDNIKTKTKKGSMITTNFFRFVWSVILFICVFPAIPFFLVMSIMFSVVKYFLLKFQVL